MAICDNSPEVEVYLGLPDGGFSVPVSSATPYVCSGMTSGSFKSDGGIDLVLGYWGWPQIALLSNLGGGSFGDEIDFDTENWTTCVAAAADLNGDGWPDVAYGQADGEVGVLFSLAQADGGLGSRLRLSAPVTPLWWVNDLVTGDFNGDGLQDVAAAGYPDFGGLAILYGTGGGAFSSPMDSSAVTLPWQIAAGKLAGGAIDDLALSSGEEVQGHAYVTGSNLGGLDSATSYSTGVTQGILLIADIDGDGSPDIVQASGSTLAILFNRGDGTFFPVVSFSLGSDQMLFVADLNSDGAPDVVSFSNSGSWTAFLNGCP